MSSSNNFTSTHEFSTSNDPNNITADNVQHYINKSRIKNTNACTQKWVRSLQEYHNKKNISYDIQTLNNKNQLEQELCEFFADMKQQDGKPYKAESIVFAYTSLHCINITDQRITNHLERRTTIQLLLDLNINEYEMMQFLEFLIVQQEKSQQEKSQIIQQEESQVIQQEESHVMQQEKSQIMQQESF
ncbi:7233_t:CDS:2 [Dentiscutata heterogama]|uniref:7233_t:CDS:1 n=1 Tax=Dentiscutata heterogama TaxID=1316150 RepID=A0ACA9JWL4_9GLOM|nr:7233_t:CDS:2 [Dentiscutata heterogama]